MPPAPYFCRQSRRRRRPMRAQSIRRLNRSLTSGPRVERPRRSYLSWRASLIAPSQVTSFGPTHSDAKKRGIALFGMDPIGFAASIITVVDIAWKVVECLNDIKHGEKERGKLLEAVTLIWLLLRRLQEDFTPPLPNLDESSMQPLNILGGPRGILYEIGEEMTELEGKLTNTTGRIIMLAWARL
jgi:hypothetical protein